MHTETPPVSTLSLTCSILITQAASHLQAYYFISLPLTSGCPKDGMGNPERGLRICLVARMGCASSAWAHRWLCCLPEPGCGWTSKIRECILCPHWRLVLRAAAFLLQLPGFLNLTPLTLSPEMRSGSLRVRISILQPPLPWGALSDHMVVKKVIVWPCPADIGGVSLCKQPLFLHLSWYTTFFVLCIISCQLLLIFYLKWLCIFTYNCFFPHEQSFYCTFYWTRNWVMMFVCSWRSGVSGEWGSSPDSLFH